MSVANFRFSKGVSHIFLLVFQFNFPFDFFDGRLVVVFVGAPNAFQDLVSKKSRIWRNNFHVFIFWLQILSCWLDLPSWRCRDKGKTQDSRS